MTAGHEYDTAEQRGELRAAMGTLTDYQAGWLDDDCLSRFLRADQGNFQKSVTRLRGALDWREATQPEKVVCSKCISEETSHYLHFVGFDKFDRPVLYSHIGSASDKVVAHNMDHIVQTLESAIMCMGPGVEKYVWISDMEGFGFGDMNPWMGKASIDLFARYYPERMARFVLADCPSLFRGVWSVLKPLIDEVTFAKIKFAAGPGSKSLTEVFDEIFDPEMKEWMLNEMKENRKAAKSKSKAWRRAGREKDGVEVQEGMHDMRGTFSFLHTSQCAKYYHKVGLPPPTLSGGKTADANAAEEVSGAGAGEVGAEGAGEGGDTPGTVDAVVITPPPIKASRELRYGPGGELRPATDEDVDTEVASALSFLDKTIKWATP